MASIVSVRLTRGRPVAPLAAPVLQQFRLKSSWLQDSQEDLVLAEGNDGVIVAVDEKSGFGPGFRYVDKLSEGRLLRMFKLSNHSRKEGAVRILHDVHPSVPRVAVVTCKSDGWTTDDSRFAAAVGARALRDAGAKNIQIEELGSFVAVSEGVFLGTYEFDAFKSGQRKKIHQVDPLCPSNVLAKSSSSLGVGMIHAMAQNWARTLAELPPNVLTPSVFADKVREEFGNKENLVVKVQDETWIRSMGMNALLAVSSGSQQPPRFLEIKFRNGARNKPSVVLVGKGITFDSGGISIKPASHMDMMKGDMGGAAAVVAAIKAIVDLNHPVNVTAIIPLCENMPSGSSYRPGDIIKSSGKSIEVINTDAEGRLILADALYYATTNADSVSCVIDVATLTGAIDVALGYYGCGMFTNNRAFFEESLAIAQDRTGELVHPMPIAKWHKKQIESSVADIRNSTDSRSGGACTAAAFLQHFVAEDKPWMHLDMAAVMHSSKTDGYDVRGMTGRPTRLLVELVDLLYKKSANFRALPTAVSSAQGILQQERLSQLQQQQQTLLQQQQQIQQQLIHQQQLLQQHLQTPQRPHHAQEDLPQHHQHSPVAASFSPKHKQDRDEEEQQPTRPLFPPRHYQQREEFSQREESPTRPKQPYHPREEVAPKREEVAPKREEVAPKREEGVRPEEQPVKSIVAPKQQQALQESTQREEQPARSNVLTNKLYHREEVDPLPQLSFQRAVVPNPFLSRKQQNQQQQQAALVRASRVLNPRYPTSGKDFSSKIKFVPPAPSKKAAVVATSHPAILIPTPGNDDDANSSSLSSFDETIGPAPSPATPSASAPEPTSPAEPAPESESSGAETKAATSSEGADDDALYQVSQHKLQDAVKLDQSSDELIDPAKVDQDRVPEMHPVQVIVPSAEESVQDAAKANTDANQVDQGFLQVDHTPEILEVAEVPSQPREADALPNAQ